MMSTTTTIEWTDRSWNPVRGCSLISAGCANCYAMKTAHRFSGKGKPYEGLTELGPQGPRWNGKIRLVHDALEEPLHWKKPQRVFVNSMSDLFHEDVPEEFLDRVMQAMANTKRHTYQVLTKRPERMRDYLSSFWNRCYKNWETGQSIPVPPCKHIWFGVSVEDQATADARIPILLQTPAAVRFISAEPLLGPVDLSQFVSVHAGSSFRAARMAAQELPNLDWIIIGGESGPSSRPCNLAWIRALKDQCQDAGTKVFIKQLGAKPYDPSRWKCRIGDTNKEYNDQIRVRLKDKKGGDIQEFPEELRVREYPTH